MQTQGAATSGVTSLGVSPLGGFRTDMEIMSPEDVLAYVALALGNIGKQLESYKAHVQEKQAGNIVDTSKTPDYTIVNPRRLSTELQNNICQRCHLQHDRTYHQAQRRKTLRGRWAVGDLFLGVYG